MHAHVLTCYDISLTLSALGSERRCLILAYNIRSKFGQTFGTRLVSLPKPSAECYNLTFSPSLHGYDYQHSFCVLVLVSWVFAPYPHWGFTPGPHWVTPVPQTPVLPCYCITNCTHPAVNTENIQFSYSTPSGGYLAP